MKFRKPLSIKQLRFFHATRCPGEKVEFFRGRGCHDCKRTGYAKRVGLYELLIIDEDIRRLMLARASNKDIKAQALKKGMLSMRVDGLRKAEKGITTVEEVLKATMEEDE